MHGSFIFCHCLRDLSLEPLRSRLCSFEALVPLLKFYVAALLNKGVLVFHTSRCSAFFKQMNKGFKGTKGCRRNFSVERRMGGTVERLLTQVFNFLLLFEGLVPHPYRRILRTHAKGMSLPANPPHTPPLFTNHSSLFTLHSSLFTKINAGPHLVPRTHVPRTFL